MTILASIKVLSLVVANEVQRLRSRLARWRVDRHVVVLPRAEAMETASQSMHSIYKRTAPETPRGRERE